MYRSIDSPSGIACRGRCFTRSISHGRTRSSFLASLYGSEVEEYAGFLRSSPECDALTFRGCDKMPHSRCNVSIDGDAKNTFTRGLQAVDRFAPRNVLMVYLVIVLFRDQLMPFPAQAGQRVSFRLRGSQRTFLVVVSRSLHLELCCLP